MNFIYQQNVIYLAKQLEFACYNWCTLQYICSFLFDAWDVLSSVGLTCFFFLKSQSIFVYLSCVFLFRFFIMCFIMCVYFIYLCLFYFYLRGSKSPSPIPKGPNGKLTGLDRPRSNKPIAQGPKWTASIPQHPLAQLPNKGPSPCLL